MKTKEIQQKYNISPDTIRKWIKTGKLHRQLNWKKGQPFDIDEEELLKVKKYYWNDRTHTSYQTGWDRDIFKEIDTPEKAYWIGFIMADGCIHIQNMETMRGHFSIDIGGNDVKHLYKFSHFVEAQEEIVQHTTHSITGNDLVHIQLCCAATLRDLYNLGLRPNKSGKETWIETPFPADFIRGCYDGDGYIKKNLTNIGLVGSYDLLSKIQQVFLQELGVEPKTIGKHGTIYRIEYTSLSDRQKIANYLWYDGCVSLDRKQELADKIKKIC